MSRQARKVYSFGFFHIMVQGLNKMYIFKDSKYKKSYMQIMKRYYTDYDVKNIAYCIMDNHVHLLLYTNDINQISEYMQKINMVFARYYNEKNKRVGYVFRDRYKSQYIYDRNYLLKCIKYIHMNPVKAKIVNAEEDYQFSSYNDYINKTGYINNEILQMVFMESNKYIKLFYNIKECDYNIIDIEEENDNIKNALLNYIQEKSVDIEKIKNDKKLLKDFSESLLKKGYRQKNIAEILSIDNKKICRILKLK